jgi:hypothetical protein
VLPPVGLYICTIPTTAASLGIVDHTSSGLKENLTFDVRVSVNKAKDEKYCYLTTCGSNDDLHHAAAREIKSGIIVTPEHNLKMLIG